MVAGKEIPGRAFSKGFSLTELMIVTVFLGILLLIMVPLYRGIEERTVKKVCNTNCRQLERLYRMNLITEGKEDTLLEFEEFLVGYEGRLCPDDGDIVYINGLVRCVLHFEDKTRTKKEDEDVPFL